MYTGQRKVRKSLSVVTNVQTDCKKVREPKRIIKFIGDMEENIENILEEISCTCGCTQFREILLIFAEKIDKLRNERDAYKNKYFADVEQLRREMKKMEEQIINVFREENSKTFNHLSSIKSEDNNVTNSFNHMENDRFPHNNNHSQKAYLKEETFLRDEASFIEHQNEGQENERMSLSKIYDTEGVERMMKKYNIGLDELEQLMKEYITEQQVHFDNQEQRKLYKLSRKLEKKIWMKKVKSDLEVLESARSLAGN